ncbi:hypothetical protein VRB23_17660 [Erwinia aphidicola]
MQRVDEINHLEIIHRIYPYASAAIVPHAARGGQQAGSGFIA